MWYLALKISENAAEIWMELEDTVLSEKHKVQKGKYLIVLLICRN